MGGEDAEKVDHDRIDGVGLAEGPRNCGGAVASQGRRSPGGGGADGAEDSLLEDQRRQFDVQVGDDTFRVGEADQLLGDVGWPLDASGVFLAIFVGVYPDPHDTQARSVGVSKSRSGPMNQLHKVGGAVYHIGAQVALELDVLVESGGEIGRRKFSARAWVRATCIAQKCPMTPGTERCMERSLLMRCSSLFTDIRLWLLDISRREISSRRCLEDRERVPRWVSITHLRISLIAAQYPYPTNTFFRLEE